jgi:hypothetical protein
MLIVEAHLWKCCQAGGNVDEHETPSTYELPPDIEGQI